MPKKLNPMAKPSKPSSPKPAPVKKAVVVVTKGKPTPKPKYV